MNSKEQTAEVARIMRKAKVNKKGIQKYYPSLTMDPAFTTYPQCKQCGGPMMPTAYDKAAAVRAKGETPGLYFRCAPCYKRVALFRYHTTAFVRRHYETSVNHH
jgi:hypothetical protein